MINNYISYLLAALLAILTCVILIFAFIGIMAFLEKRKHNSVVLYLIGGIAFTLLMGRVMGCEPFLARTIEQSTDNYYSVDYTEGNVTEDLGVKNAPNGEDIAELREGEHVSLTGRGFTISYDLEDSSWVEIHVGNQKGWIEEEKVDLF